MKKILILGICLLTLCGCGKENDNNNTKENLEQKKKIAELLKNNYIYASMSYGKLDVSDATALMNDQTYYYINNQEINSVAVLNALIDKVFVEERKQIFIDELYKNRSFIEFQDLLYVTKYDGCDLGSDYDFNDFEILDANVENLLIKFNELEFSIYIRDNELYLDGNAFICK